MDTFLLSLWVPSTNSAKPNAKPYSALGCGHQVTRLLYLTPLSRCDELWSPFLAAKWDCQLVRVVQTISR
jgi:hypothetical protein